jgi:exonuclease III
MVHAPGEGDELLQTITGSYALLEPLNPEDPWLGSVHSKHEYVGDVVTLQAQEARVRKASKGNQYTEIEIFAHEFKRIAGEAKFVVGGDLNLSLLWDQGRRNNMSREIFANLSSQGFHDLGSIKHKKEIQTYWKTNTGPFQLDHLFSDEETATRLSAFTVYREIVTERNWSDHAPVVLEFQQF